MLSNRLAILTLAVLAGCGGERASSEAANDLSRDLQRVPTDSSATLGDRASSSGASVAPRRAPFRRRSPSPSRRPRPSRSPSPAARAGSRRPCAGRRRHRFRDGRIARSAPRPTRPGQTFTATVAADVTDASGTVVIPAGSKVTLTIAEIHESENKGDKTGKLG